MKRKHLIALCILMCFACWTNLSCSKDEQEEQKEIIDNENGNQEGNGEENEGKEENEGDGENEEDEVTTFLTAQDLTDNGYFDGTLYYQITSNVEPRTVTVTNATKSAQVVGIPKRISINDKVHVVNVIGSEAFKGCNSLTAITIPSSITKIEREAFYDCTELKKVIAPDIAAWCAISFSSNPLTYAHHLYSDENVEITNLVIPNNVTQISNSSFSGCAGLASVNISNSVTNIGNLAFSYCTGLTNISIPNGVTSIGDSAFVYSGLTSVTIPSNLTFINCALFQGCSRLTSVTIPNSVTTIGKSAFSGCTGLTYVSIGAGVMDIEDKSFYGCRNLETVELNSNALVSKEYKSWRSIGGFFPGSVKKFILGETVTSIGIYAFKECNMTSVQMSDNITSIGQEAFSNCRNLTSINISKSLRQIESMVFCRCERLTSITIPNGVVTIGSSAFSQCSRLTSVTIPNSVTSIGEYAFSGCTDLTSITIPNSVTRIGIDAFNNTAWYNGQSDGIVYIGNYLYKYKGTMSPETVIVIKEGTSGIAGGAFYGCTNLTSVTIPNSVTSIGDRVFEECTGLTSINIPNSVTSIGDRAFYHCTGLTSINIPNSVTNIGMFAFWGCTSLNFVTIGNGMKEIDENAFNNCPLISIYLHAATPPSVGKSCFMDYVFNRCKLYVPNKPGVLEAYRTAYPWNDFQHIDYGDYDD